MPKRSRSLYRLAHLVVFRFMEDRCLQVAGSLTFTTLLALVPLITITLTLISAFPVFSGFSTQLKIFILLNLVPEAAGKVISVYMQQFSDNAARLTALGIAFLAVTALFLMLTIDRAFNTIWRIQRPRPVLHRLLIYWAVLTIGPLMIGASLSLTSWVVSLSMGLVKQLPTLEVALLKLISIALTSAAFGFLYLTVPNRRVARADAMLGGIISGVGFEAMKRGFGLYIAEIPTYKLVYGTFSTIPIFLMWIYLSWLVVLFGAVVVAVLPEWRAGAVRAARPPGSQFLEALQILRLLHTAHGRGEVVTVTRLRSAVRLAWEELEGVLERLSAAGWASRVAGSGWVMSRAATAITVADVYRLLVFDPQPTLPDSGARGERPLDRVATDLAARLDEVMGMTLEELFLTAALSGGGLSSAPGLAAGVQAMEGRIETH